MPKGTNLPVHIVQEILIRFDRHRRDGMAIMQACTQISLDIEEVKMPPHTVWAVLQRLRPTTDLAKMYLKAKAYRLVKRVVNKASPAEALDILSRPGMGVIEAAVRNEGGGQTGFFLSVQADTCGAVQVGVMTGPKPAELPPADFDPFADGGVDGIQEQSQTSHAQARTGHAQARVIARRPEAETVQTALARAREKLRARTGSGAGDGRQGQRDEGVQVLDGEFEAQNA